MDVTTRRAVVEDAAAIALAHTRAWQVAYDGIVPDEFLDGIDVEARTVQWRQNLTESALPDGTEAPVNLVAEVDGEVVGFACIGRWRDAVGDAQLGELWAMYVHPDQWGTGAGYALMQQTFELFRHQHVSTGYLWVLERNDLARRFYERQGWNVDAQTKDDVIGGATITERRYSINFS